MIQTPGEGHPRIESMQRVEHAYQAGVAEAHRDIERGELKLRYAARGSWGEDVERQLKSRFGVEMVWLSCLMTDESISNDGGYNDTVKAFIDGKWGIGSVEGLWKEVQKRRKQACDAHFNNHQAP
jgi:hypothetical protein